MTILLPIPPERRNAGYEGGKRGMFRASPGTTVKEEVIMIGGHEGRLYLVERGGGERLTDHRFVIVGNEVYQFMYDRHAKNEPSAASVIFFTNIKSHRQ